MALIFFRNYISMTTAYSSIALENRPDPVGIDPPLFCHAITLTILQPSF
jgi:hypothetical protein